MDPEITALASTAGTTLVTLMATDAWERTRDAVTSLWRRVHPGRADMVSGELEATREELLASEPDGDPDARQELQAEWQGRIRRLLVARPDAAEELRALLRDIDTGDAAGPAVTQHATASGNARVYQAGRDQRIEERGGEA
ncbi:hypothetical protein [Streptomyces marispadix]|uniref:Uncharacterized protein n=1 Tax=Streptomyces marispadix TaxID=2922868 RepID=A0ABS9SV98_9ACTN|nr:hypothetical protein [Streptomyces marispadix]MCH6160203.1 hypothetical protein [Streptomyces marispadix]